MNPIILVIGAIGAIGSVVFGANQLRVVIQHQRAEDVSVWDYVIRVVYSIALGIYAAAKGDLVFVVVSFVGAVLSLAVALASWYVKRKNGNGG